MTQETVFDSVHMGRSSIDLYSDDVGSPFVEITKFAAYVGGSPLNISVGGKRLGLNTVALTALGADPVGDFILHFLDKEGVETTYIPRKPGHRTSAVVLKNISSHRKGSSSGSGKRSCARRPTSVALSSGVTSMRLPAARW